MLARPEHPLAPSAAAAQIATCFVPSLVAALAHLILGPSAMLLMLSADPSADPSADRLLLVHPLLRSGLLALLAAAEWRAVDLLAILVACCSLTLEAVALSIYFEVTATGCSSAISSRFAGEAWDDGVVVLPLQCHHPSTNCSLLLQSP